MRFYALGLYSKGNTFSWKMIIGKIFADTMNFTTMPYGGAHGGAEGFWWLRKLKNIHHFHEKPTFLKLQGGRSRWGAWWGAKMEGRMGGRIFAYMVGRWGGASDTCEPICSEKNGIFAMINLINTHPIAPPHTPPMIWLTKSWNITCRHHVESKIIIFEPIFMFLWLHM